MRYTIYRKIDPSDPAFCRVQDAATMADAMSKARQNYVELIIDPRVFGVMPYLIVDNQRRDYWRRNFTFDARGIVPASWENMGRSTSLLLVE
jgi:hypothetical protein